MSERLDALAVRESNGKSYFTKIGAAFPSKNGTGGYSLLLDAMPAPTDGQFKILLMVPKPRDDTRTSTGNSQDFNRVPVDLDDDIPGF